MNYRHIYHAGNFADVIKHMALVFCLNYLQQKEAALCVIDAHGGRGLYDLNSEEALKTGEWRAGIGKLQGESDPLLSPYLETVSRDLTKGKYPGSPLICSRLLRPQDRLIANELHPDDFKALKMVLGPKKNVRVTHLDAYECIRGHIPPKERRGLVLIDPPFEKKDEFQTLCRQMKEWKKRWPTGVYLLWYPIKVHLEVDEMLQAARELGISNTWYFEALVHPRDTRETFNGSGVVIFNAPYTVPDSIEKAKPILQNRLGLFDMTTGWLSRES